MYKENQSIEMVNCDYWQSCYQFLTSNLHSKYINSINHICFCQNCHNQRQDQNVYYRGNPSKIYEIPIGCAGFAIKVKGQTSEDINKIFKNWQVSFHGTTFQGFNSISKCKMKLYLPNEQTPIGEIVKVREDERRITKNHIRTCPYTGRKIDHKVNRIFSSPCYHYAKKYAAKYKWNDKYYRIMLQTRIKPESYVIGPETFNTQKTADYCCNGQSNAELEYMLDDKNCIMEDIILQDQQCTKKENIFLQDKKCIKMEEIQDNKCILF